MLFKSVEQIFEKSWQCNKIRVVDSVSRLQLHKGLLNLKNYD